MADGYDESKNREKMEKEQAVLERRNSKAGCGIKDLHCHIM